MNLNEFIRKEVLQLMKEESFSRSSSSYDLTAKVEAYSSLKDMNYIVEASMEVEAPDDSVGFQGDSSTTLDKATGEDGSIVVGESKIRALFEEDDLIELENSLEIEFLNQIEYYEEGPNPDDAYDDYRERERGEIDESGDSGLELASGNPLDGRSVKSAMNYIYKLYKQKDHGQRYKDTGWENITSILKHFRNHNIDVSIMGTKYNPGGFTVSIDTPQWKKYDLEFNFKNKKGEPVKFPWVLTAHVAGYSKEPWVFYDLSFYPTGNLEKDEDAIFLSKQNAPALDYINEEILKLHKKTLLENKKAQIEKELRLLKEGEISHTQDWEFFPITIPLGSSDVKIFKNVIDKGIDSHLEGFTKSDFSSKDGKLVLNFHYSELPILIRRLKKMYDETGEEEYLNWAEDVDRVSKEESI